MSGPVPFILALGSNLGNRRSHLERGITFLSSRLRICALSRLVESAPWGPIPGQGDFLNLLIRGTTTLDPLDLLEVCQEAEARAGRTRRRPQGPRTLDVDVVFYGELRLDHPRLVVPHPRWRERAFVFDLLADVAGSMREPGSGRLLRDVAPEGALPGTLREVDPLDLGTQALERARC